MVKSWTNLRYVDISHVYIIHQLIIKRSGGKASIRDFTLLHSAVERPKATFGGQDLYPTIFVKAAAFLQSLTLNHPFTDGNKRTAWSSTHKFLWDNGYHLKSGLKDAVDFMLSVDNDKLPLEKIASWLKNHSKKAK